MALGDPDQAWVGIKADTFAGTACGLAMLSNGLALIMDIRCQ